jgi:RNA-directed DNA polymerase
VPNPSCWFGGKSRVTIPSELHTKTDLLKYLGMSPEELKKVWWLRARMYDHFKISKISGKFRMISAPDDRLKMLQKKIAISLAKLYRHRYPVHGFIHDRSVRTNAETHLRRRYILNIDLKDFFPQYPSNE